MMPRLASVGFFSAKVREANSWMPSKRLFLFFRNRFLFAKSYVDLGGETCLGFLLDILWIFTALDSWRTRRRPSTRFHSLGQATKTTQILGLR